MTWANIDDLFPEHPKVLAAGGDAAWLYVCGLCFTNRNLTEGRIPKAVVPRLSDRKAPFRLAGRLVDAGLWHEEPDAYVIHDWRKYNEDAETVKARKEHARTAARARWNGKPKDAQSNARAMPNGCSEHCDEHQSGMCPSVQRAMPSHSSPPPVVSSNSSSSNQGVAPAVAEEEDGGDFVAERSRQVIAERRLAKRVAKTELEPVTHPARWMAKTIKDITAEHGSWIASMVVDGMTPHEIADRVEPLPPSLYAALGSKPVEWELLPDGTARRA